jgi:hypothetical protein
MLPKPIYEALPLVYITGGLTCTMAIEAPWALISAGPLFVAAGLVMKWRHNSRVAH